MASDAVCGVLALCWQRRPAVPGAPLIDELLAIVADYAAPTLRGGRWVPLRNCAAAGDDPAVLTGDGHNSSYAQRLAVWSVPIERGRHRLTLHLDFLDFLARLTMGVSTTPPEVPRQAFAGGGLASLPGMMLTLSMCSSDPGKDGALVTELTTVREDGLGVRISPREYPLVPAVAHRRFDFRGHAVGVEVDLGAGTVRFLFDGEPKPVAFTRGEGGEWAEGDRRPLWVYVAINNSDDRVRAVV